MIENRNKKVQHYQTRYLEHLNSYLTKLHKPNSKTPILENVEKDNEKMINYLKQIENFKD